MQAAPLLCHHPHRRPDSAELRPLGAQPATFALFTQLCPSSSLEVFEAMLYTFSCLEAVYCGWPSAGVGEHHLIPIALPRQPLRMEPSLGVQRICSAAVPCCPGPGPPPWARAGEPAGLLETRFPSSTSGIPTIIRSEASRSRLPVRRAYAHE